MLSKYHCLDITDTLNNKGTSSKDDTISGQLTTLGVSFPSETLPFNCLFEFEGIPFIMVKNDEFDNIETTGQRIKFNPTYTSVIHFLGLATETNLKEAVRFEYKENTVQSGVLKFSHFTLEKPTFDNKLVIQAPCLHSRNGILNNISPCIWYTSIKFDYPILINSIFFEDNPCMHIFSMTLEGKDK